ncbi:MAG: hypothetical protein LZF60_260035 [Nitrospira sp.]|nr:MAG: hypothetical protein LZF60_260035 [Nitrospira sp.]
MPRSLLSVQRRRRRPRVAAGLGIRPACVFVPYCASEASRHSVSCVRAGGAVGRSDGAVLQGTRRHHHRLEGDRAGRPARSSVDAVFWLRHRPTQEDAEVKGLPENFWVGVFPCHSVYVEVVDYRIEKDHHNS